MTETTTNEMTVYERLAKVQEEIGAVGKDGKVRPKQGQKGPAFNYRGIEQLMNALHPILAKYGVIIVPHVLEHHTEDYRGYSNYNLISTVKVAYYVYGTEGDTLPHPVIGVGSGVDNSDKSYGKAMSYAYKMAIGQLFSIPTEADNEEGYTHATVSRQEANRPAEAPAEPVQNPRGIEVAAWLDEQLSKDEWGKLRRWFKADLSAASLARQSDEALNNLCEMANKAIAKREAAAQDADAEAADELPPTNAERGEAGQVLTGDALEEKVKAAKAARRKS